MSEMLKTKIDLVTALWKSFSTCIGLNGGTGEPLLCEVSMSEKSAKHLIIRAKYYALDFYGNTSFGYYYVLYDRYKDVIVPTSAKMHNVISNETLVTRYSDLYHEHSDGYDSDKWSEDPESSKYIGYLLPESLLNDTIKGLLAVYGSYDKLVLHYTDEKGLLRLLPVVSGFVHDDSTEKDNFTFVEKVVEKGNKKVMFVGMGNEKGISYFPTYEYDIVDDLSNLNITKEVVGEVNKRLGVSLSTSEDYLKSDDVSSDIEGVLKSHYSDDSVCFYIVSILKQLWFKDKDWLK